MKSTKKSLALSIMSLVLCVAMLLGTTYAWFTDSVTSGKNIIKSGNLDIEMYYADGTKAVPTTVGEGGWLDASDATIFNYSLWEPGYTEVKHIKIANVGTLALKYQLAIVADGDLGILADVLDVYVTDTATQIAERSDLSSSMTKIGTLSQVLANASLDLTGNLMPAGTEGKTSENTLTIAIKMQEEAGNEYKKLSVANGFTVVVKATQYTYEEDSFDNQYDKNATYPEVKVAQTYKASSTAEITTAMSKIKDGDVLELAASTTAYKLPSVSSGKTFTVTAPEGTKIDRSDIGGTGYANCNITYKNITLMGLTNVTNDNVEMGSTGVAEEHYENCTFYGMTKFYADKTTFTNCKFVQEEYQYCFWVYGDGEFTFTDCTFECKGKAAKVFNHSYNADYFTDVTFNNCTFNAPDGNINNKPAIAIATHGATFNVTCNGCTANNFNNTDTDMYAHYGPNGTLVGAEVKSPATSHDLITVVVNN